ncbi:hypothetical protein [Chryseobacterium pennipullorum]|nr:hypothetical protein [Chryseobacterium pennipullorum]
MDTKVKLALALIGTGGIVLWGLSKRRKPQRQRFVAPDGNTYEQDSIYQTYDHKLYQNGKEIHFDVPEDHQKVHSENRSFNSENSFSAKAPVPVKNINYHKKGTRHH